MLRSLLNISVSVSNNLVFFSFEEWPSRNLLCNSFCLANIDVCKVKNKGIVELKHLLREADCCLICACLLCSEKLTFKLKNK